MSAETAGIIASAISTTFAAIAIFLAWRTLKENHEWNRRKSTDDALRFLVSGDYQRLTDQFHTVVPFEEWSKVDTSYKDICESLTEEERAIAIKCSWDLLNIFESICIGMKNGILDEDIAYDYLAFILPRFFHWSQHFIEERRDISNEPRIYNELEGFARKWQARKLRQSSIALEAIRVSGKQKL